MNYDPINKLHIFLGNRNTKFQSTQKGLTCHKSLISSDLLVSEVKGHSMRIVCSLELTANFAKSDARRASWSTARSQLNPGWFTACTGWQGQVFRCNY